MLLRGRNRNGAKNNWALGTGVVTYALKNGTGISISGVYSEPTSGGHTWQIFRNNAGSFTF